MYSQHIPTYARFQWINSRRVICLLEQALPYAGTGRRGHSKSLLFRWLMYKQVMGCSYRDLESMSGVDFTTFIKFREKIKQQCWLDNVFTIVAKSVVKTRKSLTLITDSSFVEQYARHKETGAEYSGHKEKTGFKLHQIIDFRTRLPMAQVTTGGARADVILAQQLVQKLPKRWPVKSFLADKGYDSNAFAQQLHHKWFGIKVGIPVRRTGQAARKSKRQETPLNRQAKEANRCLDLKLYNKRTEVERYFSRKKYVFNLGCERTCGIDNFDTNCLMTSVMEQLEYLARPGLG